MEKIVPPNAHLVPKEAKKVFSGVIYDVYQWRQQMFDGTYETFEMLKRPDTVSAFPIVNDKLVVLKQTQPGWKSPKYGFPGGRVDPEDKSVLDALKREVKEETGLKFANWRLLAVQQREEKIEWFHYKFLATEPLGEAGEIHEDPGEKITVEYISFERAKELLKTEPRMGQGILERANSLGELLELPELEAESLGQ